MGLDYKMLTAKESHDVSIENINRKGYDDLINHIGDSIRNATINGKFMVYIKSDELYYNRTLAANKVITRLLNLGYNVADTDYTGDDLDAPMYKYNGIIIKW